MNDWRDRDLDVARRLPLGPPLDGRPGGGSAVRAWWPRVLWIVLLILVVLFAVVDRIAVRVAQSRVVGWVHSSQKLPSDPEVRIGGFPCLTQVAFGQYRDIEVTVGSLSTQGLRVGRIIAHLQGVHVPLGDAVRNQVKQIPVDRTSAEIFVTYADLNTFLKNQPGSIQVEPDGNALKITSADYPASVSTRITVENNGFTILATAIGVGGLDLPLPEGVPDTVKSPLLVPLSDLPFNLRPASVEVHQNNLELTATADKLVFEPPHS